MSLNYRTAFWIAGGLVAAGGVIVLWSLSTGVRSCPTYHGTLESCRTAYSLVGELAGFGLVVVGCVAVVVVWLVRWRNPEPLP